MNRGFSLGDIGEERKHIELEPLTAPARREAPVEPVVVPEREVQPA